MSLLSVMNDRDTSGVDLERDGGRTDSADAETEPRIRTVRPQGFPHSSSYYSAVGVVGVVDAVEGDCDGC